MTTFVTDSNGKIYQKSDTEICYNEKTPKQVIEAIDNAYKTGQRLSIRYGDHETGRDWLDEFDTVLTQ